MRVLHTLAEEPEPTHDDVIAAMLTNAAHSLAVIADALADRNDYDGVLL